MKIANTQDDVIVRINGKKIKSVGKKDLVVITKTGLLLTQ